MKRPSKKIKRVAMLLLIGFLMLSVLVLLVAATYKDDVPRGPYKLHYPAYFGKRINVPEDNDMTQEGV